MKLEIAPDILSRVRRIVSKLGLSYVKVKKIICFRSLGSKSRAVARIWSLPRIWQMALQKEPHYCLEIISERFDRLSEKDKDKVLIHELLHVPRNFSGSLLSHNHNGRLINQKKVNILYSRLINNHHE